MSDVSVESMIPFAPRLLRAVLDMTAEPDERNIYDVAIDSAYQDAPVVPLHVAIATLLALRDLGYVGFRNTGGGGMITEAGRAVLTEADARFDWRHG